MKKRLLIFIASLMAAILVALTGCASTTTLTITSTSTTTATTTVTTNSASTGNAFAIVSTYPLDGGTAITLNDKVTVTFNQAIDTTTLNTQNISLWQGTSSVTANLSYFGSTAILDPVGDMTANTTYTAKVLPGVKSIDGTPLAKEMDWSFTTGAIDSAAPTVVNTFPGDGDTQVPIIQALNPPAEIGAGASIFTNDIDAVFSEAMDPSTITTSTFMLMEKDNNATVGGTISYVSALNSFVAYFLPSNNLQPNTVYTATITTGAACLAGVHMTSAYTWSFSTGGQ